MSDTYDPKANGEGCYREAIAAKRAKLLMERIPTAKLVVDLVGEKVEFYEFERLVDVYVISSADGVVKYVGTTNTTLCQRMRKHVSDAKLGSELPIHEWMRSVDFVFQVRQVDRVPVSRRAECEKEWVARYGRDNLLNITDGGGGASGYKFAGTDRAKKISSKLRSGGEFSCLNCGAKFWRKPRAIKMGHNKYCTRGCYHDASRAKRRAAQ